MNPINFKIKFPSQILKKNKYYFLEYFNKSWNKRKLLTQFVKTTGIQELEFSDINRFTNESIECLHFTNATDVRTGSPLHIKIIKLYYFQHKLYDQEEFRFIYYILTGWNWSSIENYHIGECCMYNPMKEEIVLKKIVNDPHFIWNNEL